MNLRPIFERPALCLGIGLLAVPLAKLLFIPNYIFNFLTTLVHEIGHSLAAWLMGMPSIPTVSVAGGGVAVWQDQVPLLVVALIAAQLYLIFLNRQRFGTCAILVVILIAYNLMAWTKGAVIFATAGGMLLEVIGAGICFVVCLGVRLEHPFERPLYALWGWWMLINRTAEAVLMLTDKSYRSSQTVIESGLAAGLPSDLTQMAEQGFSADFALIVTILLGLLVLPAAALVAYLWKKSESL